MFDFDQPQTPFPFDEPPRRRGRPLFAWAVIAMSVACMAWAQAHRAPRRQAAGTSAVTHVAREWQERYLVGTAHVFNQRQGPQFIQQAATLDRGSLAQRLRYVALDGEFEGPKAALAKLDQLAPRLAAAKGKYGIEMRARADSLRRLYDDLAAGRPDAPSLEMVDRKRLTDQLGWLGRLALHPAGGPDAAGRERLIAAARRTMLASLVAMAAVGMTGLAGLIGLVALVILLLLRKKSRALAECSENGGIYAETFAVWMLLYGGLSFAAAALPIARDYLFVVMGGAMLASLAALLWPILRGVPWGQVRQDIGFNLGKRPWLEPWAGVGSYATALPLLFVGVLMVLALVAAGRAVHGAAGPPGLATDRIPSHPIVGWVLNASWWVRLQVLIVASVVAPLVEETMFRGVLHRHLRDATAGLGYIASALASATVASFIFAAIHPQGLLAVPALMALAYAFTLVREWRGTLVPGMVAHGLNNGLAMCLLISLK